MKGRYYATRTKGVKRMNVVQARLNEDEREKLDRLKRALGVNDSAIIRRALARLFGEGETAG